MQRFYADVAAAGLQFSTPEVLAIERVDGLSVTYERKLPGQPLQHGSARRTCPAEQNASLRAWSPRRKPRSTAVTLTGSGA
jgi:hypothetical protein